MNDDRNTIEPHDDDYFGSCPICGNTDGFLNVGSNHWFVCDQHRVRWLIGSNLFSGWREQTEEYQREQFAKVADYTVLDCNKCHAPPLVERSISPTAAACAATPAAEAAE